MIVLAAGPSALSRLMQADRTSEGGLGQAARRQTSSTAMATASPPPIHRLATPFVPPRA
ncbi:hypothetical protein BH09PSE1_BH09PSE1_29700 [soil metagenome]